MFSYLVLFVRLRGDSHFRLLALAALGAAIVDRVHEGELFFSRRSTTKL